MERGEIEALILNGEVLPPTLAAELVQSLDSLSPEVFEQLAELITKAGDADRAFGRVSREYRACIEEIEQRALRRVADEEQRIMEQFELELQRLTK